MPASYPSSIKSFVTRAGGDTIAASHINDVQAEIAAIESDLLNATPTFLATATSGINASALSTGTVANARLDSNVIFTTSTTGINASALSTGTVPDGRMAGAYTAVTSLTLGANVVANVTTVFVGNSSVNTAITAGAITLSGVAIGGGDSDQIVLGTQIFS